MQKRICESGAATGGGNFYEATSASELLDAFRSIFNLARTETASFAAPSVSVSAFENRINHNNEIYYALFKPSDAPRWHGNIKKYKLCDDESSCPNTETLLDKDGEPVTDPNARQIRDGATSYWSTVNNDGADVIRGGAGSQLLAGGLNARRIYTLTDTSISTRHGTVHNIDITTGDDNQNPSGNYIHPDNEELTKKLLLGGLDSEGAPLTEETADKAMTDEVREELINWIRGQDVMDENNNDSTTDLRWMLGDPLHGSPGAITYGGDEEHT